MSSNVLGSSVPVPEVNIRVQFASLNSLLEIQALYKTLEGQALNSGSKRANPGQEVLIDSNQLIHIVDKVYQGAVDEYYRKAQFVTLGDFSIALPSWMRKDYNRSEQSVKQLVNTLGKIQGTDAEIRKYLLKYLIETSLPEAIALQALLILSHQSRIPESA